MKLHLPSGLRKALLACLAALALPAASFPTTLASASGIAAVFLATSQRASAESLGPDGVMYQDASYSTSMAVTQDTNVALGAGGSVNTNTDIVFGNITAGVNLKLTATDGGQYSLTTNLSEAKTLWLTVKSRFLINADVFGANTAGQYGPETIYVDDAQLWFGPWANPVPNFTETTKLQTSFVIGTCEFQQMDEGSELQALSYAALRVGTNVETTGGLTLVEDAKIGFQNNSTTSIGSFSFDGAISGAGHKLTVAAQQSGNTLTFGSGGTLGSMDLGNGVTLSLTNGLTLETGLTIGASAKITLVGGTFVANAIGATNGATITLHNGAKLDFSDITGGKLTINLSGFSTGEYDIFGDTYFDTWFNSHTSDWNNSLEFTGLGQGLNASLITDSTGGHKGWLKIDGTLNVQDLELGTKSVEGQEIVGKLIVKDATAGTDGIKIQNSETLTVTGVLEGTGNFDLRISSGVNNTPSTGQVILEQGGSMSGRLNVFDGVTVVIGKAGDSASEALTLSVAGLGGNCFSFSAAENHTVTLQITTGATDQGTQGVNVARGQSGKHAKFGTGVTLELNQSVTQLVSGVDFEAGSHAKLGESSVLKFMNGTYGDTGSSFAGALEGTGTLQVEGDTSSSHRLEWSGTSTSFTGTLSVGANGIFDMSKDFSSSKITLASNSTIRVTSGILKTTTLELGANTATLEITLANDEARLSFGSITQSSGGKIVIKLTGWEGDTANNGYQLFESGNTWNTLWSTSLQNDQWKNIFEFQNDQGSALTRVKLDQNGKITQEALSGTLTWSGSGDSMIWSTSSNVWGTGGNEAYNENSNVVFAGTNTGLITVTVSSDVGVAGDMTVQKGAGGSGGAYLFDVDNNVTIDGELVIDGGTDVEFDVAGTKKLSASSTTVKGKLTIGGNDSTGNGNKSLGDVDIQSSGEVVIKQAWNLFNNGITNCFHGDGKLTMDLSGYSDKRQDILNQFNNVIGGANVDKKLETFEFKNAYIDVAGDGTLSHFKNLHHVIVGENSSFLLDAPGEGDNKWGSNDIVLHLSGTGVGNGTSTGNGTLADAALSFFTYDSYYWQGSLASRYLTVTTPWSITLDGDATVRIGRDDDEAAKRTLQLNDTLDFGPNHKLTKTGSGALELTGGSFNTSGSNGTIDVQKGTLKLSYTGSDALSSHTVNLVDGTTLESGITGSLKALTGKGTVKVTGGKLTLTTANGAELTQLAINSGELAVNAGNFTISGGWTWGEGAKLTLSAKEQQITLSGISQLNGGSPTNKLTIHLNSAFFGDVNGATGIQLFNSNGFTKGWEQYFTVEAEDEVTYQDLQLDSTGKLTWTHAEAKELIWNKGSDQNTWDAAGVNENWGNNEHWSNAGNVTALFNDGTGEEVTVEGAVKAAAVKVTQGTGWTFKVKGDNSLTVSGDLTVSGNSKLTLSGGGKVSAKNVTLTDGSIELSNTDLHFSGSITGGANALTGTGYALYAGGGSMSWSDFLGKYGSVLGESVGVGAADQALTITDAVSLDKAFKAGDNSKATFSGGVTFNTNGKLVLGDDAEIVLGGTLANGTANVSVTHEGTEGGTGKLTMSVGGNAEIDMQNMSFAEGVILHVDGPSSGTGVTWGTVKNLNVLGELQLAGHEVILVGTNTIKKLDTSGLTGKFSLTENHTKTTLQSSSKVDVEVDMRAGELAIGTGTDDSSTTLTLKGGLRKNSGSDEMKITGANLTFAGSFAEHKWEGGLDLKKLTMSGGTQKFTGTGSNATLSVGSLAVTGGSLTMGSAGKEMAVKTGGINITGGTFTWAGSKMSVTGDITMGGVGAFEVAYSSGLELAWSAANITGSITLTLTGFADAQVTNDGYALFGTSGWKAEWADKILVKGTTAEGNQLTLDANGKVVILADGENLYWPGSVADTELAWGASGGNEWAKGSSTGDLTAWTTNSHVHLGATGTATVTLKDAAITAADITFTAANATDGYTFTSDVQEGSTLLVRGNMSNKNDNSSVAVKAVFDDKVNVRVMGDFISTGAKGDFLFKKKLTVDGLLQLWNQSVLQLDEGGEVGTLDASWDSVQIKLGGDLKVGNWFFEGNAPGGHQVSFTRTGDDEVFIDVGRVVGGLSGTQSQAGTLPERELTINGTGVMTIGEGVGIKKSSGTLTFGESSQSPQTFVVGGSYAAVSGGEMVFNVDATAGMNVEIGEGSSITVKEGKSLTATGKLKGTGGTLILESSATATFTGGVDASSNLTSLQLAQGAKLSAGGAGKLDVGTLTLTGNATIELDGTQKGSIKLRNAIVGFDQHALTITLTGLTDEGSTALLTGGYQLFDTGMSANLLSGLKTLFDEQKLLILLGDCTYDYQLGADGKLTFTNDTVTLTHTGSGAAFTWDNDSATWDEGGQTFAGANSVKFTGTGNNTVTLAIPGTTTVKMMTVQTTDGGVYTFAPTSGTNTLTVTSRLDLESAAVFQVGTEVRGEMRGNGALTVDGKTFNLSSARAHSWTGELTVQNAGTFSLAGTVTATKLTVGTDGGTVDLSGAGAVLTVTGDIAGDGNALTLTGGGKLDWTGTTGALGSANIENGEFAIGGTLTMGGNIALGQNGKISGSGTINKKDNDVYVQFQVDGDESISKTVDAWVKEKLNGVTLGEGVGLQKTGAGTLSFADTGGTLNYDLDIAEGAVQFNGNNYTLKGKLTGKGNFNVATAATGRAPASKTLTMEKGGSLSGDMALSQWGARLSLGGDLEVGGITKLLGADLMVTADGSDNNRFRTVLSLEDVTANLTVNVVEGEVKEVDGLVVEQGVTLVKKGAGTQKFTTSQTASSNAEGNGTTQLKGGVKVDEGFLEFEGAGSVISGALSSTHDSTGGTLKLTSGDLTLSGGGTHGGILEMTEGKITVSGAALEVGTFKATTGELDVQSDLTIGKVDEGSTLTTLKIASDTTVAVRKGTLKATTLDLTGTTGASLEVGMDGSAKLDFGSITLGRNGKLSITMTGYDGEKTYQLFESTTFGSVWDALVTGGKQWNEVFDITGIEGRDLTLNRDGSLTIQPKGIDWSGGSDDTWSDNESGEWEGGTVPPTGRDVTFTAEAAQEHGDVTIDGTVHPRNVYVDGGDYTFTQKEGTTGGLNMSEADGGGTLKVGGGGTEARLTLELENTSVPRVELGNRGTLVLANDKALTDETEILFSGGVLEYSGVELSDADLSGKILKYGKGGSTGAVKVSVDDATYTDGVTWGGAKEDVASNGGLWHAVHESVNQGGGMEKSGTGKLTLEWQEAETETGEPTTHRGAVTVREGELQYKIHTADATDATDATDVTMRGAVTVEEGGTFTLSVYGGGVVEYIEALNGEGTVSLGGEDGDGTVKLSADSSGFKGTVRITAGIVEVSNENALGGSAPEGEEAATLELSGGNLTGNDITVNTENVLVSGGDAVLSGVTLAGKVTGENGVAAKDGATAGLSGDISEYAGELKTGESGTWKLSDKALSQPVGVAVSGNGVVEFAGDAIYRGKVSDSVTLRGDSGKLTVTSRESSVVAKLDGNVTLGNLGTQAVWNGTELVSGDIYLSNVVLGERGIGKKGDAKLYVNTAKGGTAAVAAYNAREATPQGGIVNVNGMAGSRLDGITINAHGQLQGITGRYTANSEHQLELHFTDENVSDAATGAQALITAGTAGFNLNASSKADVGLYLETDAVASIIGKLAEATSDATVDVYLHLLEGGELRMGDLKLTDLKGDDVGILSSLYIESVMAEGGNIRLTGSAADVYVAPKGNSTLTDEDREQLDKAGATVLANPGDHLTLSMDGETSQPEEGPDVIVKNLLGVTGSQLSLENSNGTDPTGANRLEVAFNNTHASTLANADKYPGEIDGTTVYGQDTTFNGKITGGEGVDVRKQGLGTLTVGDSYTLSDGTTTLAEGALRLRGDGNSMENLAFSYDKPRRTDGKQGADGEVKEEERGLLLEGGTTTITGSITEEGSNEDGNDINLSQGAKLTLTGDNTLEKTTITGDEENGSGTLVLDGADAGLTLNGTGASIDDAGKVTGAQLSGVDVQLTNGGSLTLGDKAGMDAGKVELGKGGTLDIGNGTANHVDSLGPITEEDGEGGTITYRDGTLKSAQDGVLHVGGGSFSGTLGMSDGATSAGTLAVDSGADFTLDNAKSTATDSTTAWNVNLGDGANLTVNVSGKYDDGTEVENPGKLTLGGINLGNGKMTVNYGDRINQNPLSGTITGVGENGGTLDFFSSGEVEDGDTGITLSEDLRKDWENFKEKHITFSGAGNFLKDNDAKLGDDGKITVSSQEAEDNKFERLLPDMSKNARAGASMVWDSLKEKSQDEAFFNALLNPTSDYDSMASALIGLYDNGDKEGLEKALVAVAGTSISVLGPAVVDDLHRQLTTMRNRTTMTTNEQRLEQYDVYPMWHAWLNAEGAYRKLDADGFAPGYTLNSWGGTVGVDADVSERTTVGLALTAMFGDLKTDGADVGKGDLDTMYLSAFARTTRGAWSHTFVMSAGMADVSLDRTVNVGGVSYRTQGSTDGFAVGALYEVGYTKLVNRRGTVAFQPVFNVEIRHAAIKGYTETGSNAGLRVDDIEQDVVTFGVGARMQGIVGENIYNRTSILEGRLLVKGDVGDRSGVAKNALTGSARTGEVESAEVGALGIEAGVGLSIPLGSQLGNLFFDASAELRSGQTSFDATVGYRISF